MPPEALARLQADLFAAITGLPVGDAARAADQVAGDARASAERRIQVYTTMYRLRIVEALESQFPRVARALGPDAFGAAALAFVADVPSRHPSLRELGRGFAAWLAQQQADPRPDERLPALARLEWARADVFDLADQAVLTLDALRGLPPDRFAALPLRLVDAHRFVDADAATLELWRRSGEGSGESNSDAIEASGGALVWRQDVDVHHRGLSALEREALQTVAAGTTFGMICERLAAGREDGEAATQAFTWLSTWVLDGLLTA